MSIHSPGIFEANHSPGDVLAHLQAGSKPLHGVFFSAAPLKEPVFSGGPFMGNTADDISAYKRAFARDDMGTLSKSF